MELSRFSVCTETCEKGSTLSPLARSEKQISELFLEAILDLITQMNLR